MWSPPSVLSWGLGVVSLLEFLLIKLTSANHSTLQRGMLHTAAEGGTATEGDREGGRGAGEGDLGVGEGPGGGGGGGVGGGGEVSPLDPTS